MPLDHLLGAVLTALLVLSDPQASPKQQRQAASLLREAVHGGKREPAWLAELPDLPYSAATFTRSVAVLPQPEVLPFI